MSKVICVANRKGGVGKTTLAVLLAQAFQALGGKPTLLIDLDPQASATYALAGAELYERIASACTIERALSRPFSQTRRPESFIWGQVSALTDAVDTPLALLGASPELWTLEEALRRDPLKQVAAEHGWSELIKKAKRDFEIIVIDTAPGRTFLAKKALKKADLIVAPCDVTPVAVQAMTVFHRELQRDAQAALQRNRVCMVWTKFSPAARDAERLSETEKALRERLVKTGFQPFENLQSGDALQFPNVGLPANPAFAEGVSRTMGQRFDERYPRAAGIAARQLYYAARNRLGLGDYNAAQ